VPFMGAAIEGATEAVARPAMVAAATAAAKRMLILGEWLSLGLFEVVVEVVLEY